MKNGRKPKKAQKIFIENRGYNSEQYLIERDTSTVMVLIHKESQSRIEIEK